MLPPPPPPPLQIAPLSDCFQALWSQSVLGHMFMLAANDVVCFGDDARLRASARVRRGLLKRVLLVRRPLEPDCYLGRVLIRWRAVCFLSVLLNRISPHKSHFAALLSVMSGETLSQSSAVIFASFSLLLLLPNSPHISTFIIYTLSCFCFFVFLPASSFISLQHPPPFSLSSSRASSPNFISSVFLLSSLSLALLKSSLLSHSPPGSPLFSPYPAEPDWASLTLGVFVCQACSLLHRSIPHISRVKSVQETWDASEVEVGH